MIALYVISSKEAAGKTAICAGLGKHLADDGQKVGFFKPLIVDGKQSPVGDIDRDAAFMQYILGLEESADSLCPVISGESNIVDKIKQACARVAKDKDVVIIEGMGEPGLGSTCHEITEALAARVIIVEDYAAEFSQAKLIDKYKAFGEHLLGVVLNKVPVCQMERVRSQASAQFSEAGIDLIAVLPEDRTLFTLTVGEIAEHIGGEILNCTGKSSALVDNFMLGAMCVDPGPEYFGRKTGKAVIVRDGRPDMQLAALETSLICLILTGSTKPTDAVLYGAENKEVPVILTTDDTLTIVANIEDALGRTKFNQEKKLPRLAAILEQHFNFQPVYRKLGLAS